jgi:hypothetical protein
VKNIIVYVITAAITIWFFSRVLYPASQTLTHGFGAYYSAARLLQSGQFSAQVYDPAYFRPIVRADSHQQADDIYFANPPTTSLMLWPLSFLPIETARFIWTLANALMLWGGLALLVLNFAPQFNLPTFALLITLGMLFQPVVENIRLGQAYLLIFLLLTMAVAGWSKTVDPGAIRLKITDTLSGTALALALTLKTAGWALLPLLAWQRRWRILAWTIIIGGTILLLTLPLFWLPMWQRYWQLLNEANNSPQTCAAAYQTTRSLLCHLFVFEPPWSPSPVINRPWLAPILLICLALFTFILNLKLSRQQEIPAIMATLAWGVIFAPLGEEYHHTVMLIPLGWLVINRQSLQKSGWSILLAAILLYLIPLPPNQAQWHNNWWALLVYLRLYGAWLTLLACHLGRPERVKGFTG